MFIINNFCLNMFRASLCPSSGEQRPRNLKYYIFWVGVCSLCYPARNTHAQYRHQWPVPLYHTSPHYLINGTIFGKKLPNTKCVFWVSLQHFPETLLILGRTERDMVKNIYRSACTVPVIVVVRFQQNLIFVDRFSKSNQMSNFTTICHVGDTCSMRTDRQTRWWK